MTVGKVVSEKCFIVSPILITTFFPRAQRYVTMAALRAAVRPSPAPRRGVHRPTSAGASEK